MSFWRFNFAQTSVVTIESLLNALPPSSSSVTDAELSPPDVALYESTLDSLLAMPDLLSEIKTGSDQRLTDFLARAHVVNRLGGWVVWGLGGPGEIAPVENGDASARMGRDRKEKEPVVAPVERWNPGMGGVPRRRDMDELGVLEGATPETQQELSWAGFPRLCAEILCSELPSLSDILFNPSAASSFPKTCPAPLHFLVPFWESLLRSTETQLETRSVQVGYWTRVNAVLLSGPKSSEALSQILEIPNLLPRLLKLLPNCSPINDLLLLLLRQSKTPSPFTESVIPHTIQLLDPLSPIGSEGHSAAEELLRGIIELCSATPPPMAQQPGVPAEQGNQQPNIAWRENGLARQISEAGTVRKLMQWILPGVGAAKEAIPNAVDEALMTSSLVQSLSVLIDLIRKNNSDYVEQQMLGWARKREAEDGVKQLMELEGAVPVDEAEEADRRKALQDKGPALIDLGPLLRVISEQIGGFQELLKNPRSPHDPVSTTAGPIEPLTLERFRIAELYAELLHCSNMSLLNRPERYNILYDSEGRLANGWLAADDLAAALSAPTQEDTDSESRTPANDSTSAQASSEALEGPVSESGRSTTSSVPNSLDSGLGHSDERELRDLTGELSRRGNSSDSGDPFADSSATREGDVDSHTPLANQQSEGETSFPWSLGSPNFAPHLLPGQLLKTRLIEHGVVGTMLDLFFRFPCNNFLHNVVFDILQQIFHGVIGRRLDQQLALSIFLDARLIDRILAGQIMNDTLAGQSQGARLGYMGHMTLISEEIVKLFERYPTEIYSFVEPHIPQPQWNDYVTTTLRETRERDSVPLGGGVVVAPPEGSSSITTALSDEDDEFPLAGGRVSRASEAGIQLAAAPMGLAKKGKENKNASAAETEPVDRFSQYLANSITNDPTDKFGSSDEDDEDDDVNWLGGARFDPSDADFGLTESNGEQKKFTFAAHERFDSVDGGAESDDDAEWGDFSVPTPSTSAPFPDDAFRPPPSNSQTAVSSTSTTQLGFESSFSDDPFASASFLHPPTTLSSAFTDNFDTFASTPTPNGTGGPRGPVIPEDDDDEFGDFASGTSSSIVIPSSLDDFDLDESTRTPSSFTNFSSDSATSTAFTFTPKPIFARTQTVEDGSSLFGGLSSAFDDADADDLKADDDILDNPLPPSSPLSPRPQTPPTSSSWNSPSSPNRCALPSSPDLIPRPLHVIPTPLPSSPSSHSHSHSNSHSSPSTQFQFQSPPPSPSFAATSASEPLGPRMHEGAIVTADGFVQVQVEGNWVQVPADDIVLAARRNSVEGRREEVG